MKSLLLSACLAFACAAAQGAEPVPVIEQAVLVQADETVAAPVASADTASPAVAVPEPEVLPMLAVGIVLVLLRLSRKGRNDTFK